MRLSSSDEWAILAPSLSKGRSRKRCPNRIDTRPTTGSRASCETSVTRSDNAYVSRPIQATRDAPSGQSWVIRSIAAPNGADSCPALRLIDEAGRLLETPEEASEKGRADEARARSQAENRVRELEESSVALPDLALACSWAQQGLNL